MESKPPPEEGKEDKTQGTAPKKKQPSLEECKLMLELTKQAAYLSLLEFEAEWNPDGDNDSHLYEDERDELVKAHRKLCKDAQHLYNIAITCEWPDIPMEFFNFKWR